MSKPYNHAVSSAEKFGGIADDYLEIHNFMDSSKVGLADPRHRAIFHSTFGCFVVENVFGVTITNSDNKEVSTRDIAEQHILEDLGFIPTLEKWLEKLPLESWMSLHLQTEDAKTDAPFDESKDSSDSEPGENSNSGKKKSSPTTDRKKSYEEILKDLYPDPNVQPLPYIPPRPSPTTWPMPHTPWVQPWEVEPRNPHVPWPQPLIVRD